MGEQLEQTKCSLDYLKNGGDLFDSKVPFTVGALVGGNPFYVNYSKFDLYACRLYTRILSDTEIAQNYTATTDYHNELVKE